MVAREQPVAAWMLVQDWPAETDTLITLGVLWAALIAALRLGPGLALRLPAAPVVVVFPCHSSEHVEQHAIDRVGQPRHRLAFNRFRLGACKQSLRGHLISNVDRSQQRLIVRKDECASRVAITRGLVVQS